jgi:curved DNA-binding protein
MSARDALDLLGLDAGAGPDGLRGAYLAAVKTAHPDRPGGDAERLRRVIEAYDVLRAQPARASSLPTPSRPASQPLEITPAEAVTGGLKIVSIEGAGEASVRLPMGLRVGDIIAVSGVAMTVAIRGGGDMAVVGDHLCITLAVDPAVLAGGGTIEVSTPRGVRSVRISAQDAARRLARIADGGLPARGRHVQGDLVIKLKAKPVEAFESRTRVLLRRFTAAWAA